MKGVVSSQRILMKIEDLILETGTQDSKITKDDIGGRIIISPHPGKYLITDTFSIKYINEDMAKIFRVNPRILGYDSNGHGGRRTHHLHILQKSKGQGYLPSTSNLEYEQAYQLFSEILEVIIKKYKGKQNENL